jgi:hypothetical protein
MATLAPMADVVVDDPSARPSRVVTGIVAAVVVAPLVAAMAGQLWAVGADYHAVGDLADIELHTRDIGAHPVRLGQYSRGDWSHPGPAQFYALLLPYRLTGSQSVSANVGALLINAASVVGILLLARRRGGAALFWPAAVGCAVLLRGFGPAFLIEPWNPSMPVLPFGLFLFLVWEITCKGTWAIPVAAAVGTFCIQTHIGYASLVPPLALAALAWVVVATVRHGEGSESGVARAALVRSGAVSLAVLGVLWLPPVIDQLRGTGNLERIWDFFVAGEGEAHTLGEGVRSIAPQLALRPEWVTGNASLNPFSGEPDFSGGIPLPVLLVPIALAALVWWRRRHGAALRLLALSGLAGVLSVVAISRTLGPLYHYRLGWTRLVAVTAVIAVGWALWTVAAERWPARAPRVLLASSLVAIVALSAAGVPRFARSGPPLESYSDDVALLAPDLMAALPEGEGPVVLRCDGDQGCIYLAGLVLWMERRGIEAEVDNTIGVIASGAPHRVHDGGAARATLHVAIDRRFQLQAAQEGNEVLAFEGAPPSPEAAVLAAEIEALDAQRAAGEIDERDYFFERQALSEAMGTTVGVVLVPS